jgi:hypothetical protein
LPPIESDQTDYDFAVYLVRGTSQTHRFFKLLERRKDPRVLLWTRGADPGRTRPAHRFRRLRKLIFDWQGKETRMRWLWSTGFPIRFSPTSPRLVKIRGQQLRQGPCG